MNWTMSDWLRKGASVIITATLLTALQQGNWSLLGGLLAGVASGLMLVVSYATYESRRPSTRR